MKGFFEKLVKACPSLPFLALGVWLAWAYIAYSGTAWLSDTEMNGANISTMYIVSTLTFGIVLLASTFRAARIRQLLDRPAVVIAGGAFASLGCLVIVLIGPYYLTKVLPYDLITALFYIASACTGLGTAVVGLKCGQLYGAIAPRKAILYTALSHVAIAVIYFTVIGSPSWQPVPGGPSLAGILAFVGMPLAAAGAAALSFIAPSGEKAERGESRSRFPRSFWKLAAVTFAFSFVVVALRSMLVEVSPIDVTLDNTRLVMLLRMAMALVFAAAAIGVEGERFDFGKIYSVIMAAVVALIAFCPIVGVTAPQPSAFRCRGIPCEPTPATCTRSWISIRAKSSSTSSTAPPNVRRSADQTNRIESAVITAQAPSSKTSRRAPSFLKRSR